MQIRVKVEVFGDKEELNADTVTRAIAEGIVCGDLILPKGRPISIKMRNILTAVVKQVEGDTDAH